MQGRVRFLDTAGNGQHTPLSLMLVMLDEAGATIFSFLGQIALDLFAIAMQPRRTVAFPQAYPAAVLNAAVGLPGHKVLGHPLFAEEQAAGQAVITATCLRGDLTFIEFDRDVLPPSMKGYRTVGHSIGVHYQDPTHFELTIIGPSDGRSGSDHR